MWHEWVYSGQGLGPCHWFGHAQLWITQRSRFGRHDGGEPDERDETSRCEERPERTLVLAPDFNLTRRHEGTHAFTG